MSMLFWVNHDEYGDTAAAQPHAAALGTAHDTSESTSMYTLRSMYSSTSTSTGTSTSSTRNARVQERKRTGFVVGSLSINSWLLLRTVHRIHAPFSVSGYEYFRLRTSSNRMRV